MGTLPVPYAVPAVPKGDLANQVVQGTFTATGSSVSAAFYGPFNVSVWGTFAGTIVLERSFDGSTTWLPRTDVPGNGSYTAVASFVVAEPERGVLYRLRCSVFTSGTMNYRMSATGAAAMAWAVSSVT
jgi:hypothetical protein